MDLRDSNVYDYLAFSSYLLSKKNIVIMNPLLTTSEARKCEPLAFSKYSFCLEGCCSIQLSYGCI